jgi:hypothetical protein
MKAIRVFIFAVFAIVPRFAPAQNALPATRFQVDSDHDGMSDQTEQALLDQFAPAFIVGRHDCSNVFLQSSLQAYSLQ